MSGPDVGNCQPERGEFGSVWDDPEKNLIDEPNPELATDLLKLINRQTLGQLIKRTANPTAPIDHLESLLSQALTERNRLSHSFYRQHNNRRNSEEGRSLMMNDLESIHNTIISAYKEVMKFSGIDLDSIILVELPIHHLPI
jgi:hypothetical protein